MRHLFIEDDTMILSGKYLHKKNTSRSRTPLKRWNASVLLKVLAISGLPWQHRADVRWPTLWDTFLSVLTLFIHRFKPSIHICNPPSHRHSTDLFPLSHSYTSVFPQLYIRFPTAMTPLSYIRNSVIPYTQLRFLSYISPPHGLFYSKATC